MQKLMVFDWDGTLSDSVPMIDECMRKAASDTGLAYNSQAMCAAIGLPLNEVIRHGFALQGDQPVDALRNSYIEHYKENVHRIRLFDGIEAMLQKYEQRGVLLAVATGKSKVGIDRSLAALGWQDRFALVKSGDCAMAKPHPQMLLDIIDQLGACKGSSIMVGDAVFDIRMANSAEVPSIAVEYGAASKEALAASKPTWLVSDVKQLDSTLEAFCE